jgi:Tfp pilus assembly protein PilN
MRQRPIHILHLTSQGLSWITLESGATISIRSSGQSSGEPARTLRDWAEQLTDRRATVRLYDGRPRYLSFVQRIPRKALAQQENLVRLRLRQELGLGEDALCWASLVRPCDDAPGQADLNTIVARRDALDDVLEWRRRNDLSGLWVGADVCAIRALLHRVSPGSRPTMIVRDEPTQATLYQTDGGDRVLKAEVEAPVQLTDLGWKRPASRAHFGSGGGDWFARGAPELIMVPELHPTAWEVHFPGLAGRLHEFDPVLLGGILESRDAAAAMASLLPEATASAAHQRIVERLTVRQLAVAVGLSALALGLSMTWLHSVRNSALERLDARNRELRLALVVQRSQAGVLERVKADRHPTIPLFEAILEAAPNGMTLSSIQLRESGTLQLSGSAQSADAPTQLIKSLAQSPLIENIQPGPMRADPNGRGQSFEVTAHVKGWGR